MFRLSESRFALRLAGVEHGLDVVRLRGRERINGLYRYDLGDVVRIVGWCGEAPRMVFVRKAGSGFRRRGETLVVD